MNRSTIIRRSVLLLLLLAGTAAPAPPTTGRTAPREDLANLLAEHSAEHRTLAVCVVSLPDGETVFAHNAGQALLPASNQKLLTSYVALQTLGAEYDFTTRVLRIENHLAVVGDFDPILGDPRLANERSVSIYRDLDRMAEEIRRRCGPNIDGDLLMVRRFPETPLHHADWTDWDKSRWYGAPVSELNFHNNCYDVTFVDAADAAGQALLQPVLQPAGRFIEICNQTTRGDKQLWRLNVAEDESRVDVLGTLKQASPYPLSVPCKTPSLLLGRVFRDRLARAGVTLTGRVRCVKIAPEMLATATELTSVRTPLRDVLLRANRNSLNLAADCLLLRAGDGTWDGSTQAMQECLQADFPKHANGLAVRDGSGLSRENRASASLLTEVLRTLANGPGAELVVDSLAVSGEAGSLERRLGDAPYRGRVVGKTGTLRGCRALSGYILDTDGKPAYAFSVLVNGLTATAGTLQDRLCAILLDTLDASHETTDE
jgi:D-alanyl-D-alanine carboxypeptidase/D-alanyl-D-alanine-endopeptidase (penicillin-binding protein 4)